MFSSGFVNRNQELVSVVLTKYIENKRPHLAFEYFKHSLSKFQLSTLEVIVLSALLNGRIYKKQVKEIISFYEHDLASNMLLFAHLLNENYANANKIFSVNLKRKVDLKVLERCVSQIQSNEVLRRTSYAKRVSNFLKFKPFVEDTELKSEINSIINNSK
jgi:hypothetical protein